MNGFDSMSSANFQKQFLMYKSILQKDYSNVEDLLNNDLNINQKIGNFTSVLALAAEQEVPENQIVKLIKCGADVNHQDDSGKCALYHSVTKNNETATKILLESKANPDIIVFKNENECETPLLQAVRNKNLTIVKLLLHFGANPNFSEPIYGISPLINSVIIENQQITEILIQYGADVNQQDWNGKTALNYLKTNHNQTLENLLIENGAKRINQKVNSSEKLYNAIENEDTVQVINLLKQGIHPDSDSKHEHSCLFLAIERHNFEIIRQLINYGANVNRVDKVYRQSPIEQLLFVVCRINKVLNIELTEICNLIQLFINKSASLINSSNHSSAIHEAVTCCSFITNVLLQNGINVNLKYQNGRTPLMDASRVGNLEVVKLLIEHNADIDCQEYENGNSALMFAVNNCNYQVVKLLIQKGANINLLNYFDESALSIAVRAACNKSLIRNSKIKLESRQNLILIINLLIINNKTINIKSSSDNQTPISFSKTNDSEIFTILNQKLTSKESTQYFQNARSKILDDYFSNYSEYQFRTPLIVAIQTNNISFVNYLLNTEININETDSNGNSALIYAVEKNLYDIVKQLIGKNASILHQNNEGKSAIDCAVKKKNDQIYNLLQSHILQNQKIAEFEIYDRIKTI